MLVSNGIRRTDGQLKIIRKFVELKKKLIAQREKEEKMSFIEFISSYGDDFKKLLDDINEPLS